MHSFPLRVAARSAMIVPPFFLACGGSQTAGYVGITQFEKPGAVVVGYDAARRGAYLRLGAGGVLEGLCAEPPPDAITTLAASLGLKGSGQGSAGGAQASAAAPASGSASDGGQAPAAGLGAAGPAASGALDIANQFAQTATKLGDPTSATLFLREVLYRGCEAQFNNKSAAVANLFNTTIEAYKAIVTADERGARLRAITTLVTLVPDTKQKDPKLIALEGAASSDPDKLADLYAYAATLLPAVPAGQGAAPTAGAKDVKKPGDQRKGAAGSPADSAKVPEAAPTAPALASSVKPATKE